MTRTGAFVVLMSLAWLVCLMVLVGWGTVCDITGPPVLFIPVCAWWGIAELCPLLPSVSFNVLVFPPCSATAARLTPPTTLEMLLLAGPEDIREATLQCVPFFCPSPSILCFVDLSVGCPDVLLVFDIRTLSSSLVGAAVHLEELDVDFSPFDTWLLQDGWGCWPKSGLELVLCRSWNLSPVFAVEETVFLPLTRLFWAVVGKVFPWAMEDLLETKTDEQVLDCTWLATEVEEVVVLLLPAVAEVCIKFRLFLGWGTAGMSPVFVWTIGPRLSLALSVFTGPVQVALEVQLNLLFEFVTFLWTAFEKALPEDCIPVFGCSLRRLAVFWLALEDLTVYILVSTGLSLGWAGPLVADGWLVLCCPVSMPLTFTLFFTPNTLLAGGIEDRAATVGAFVISYWNLSAGASFSFPTTCKIKNTCC